MYVLFVVTRVTPQRKQQQLEAANTRKQLKPEAEREREKCAFVCVYSNKKLLQLYKQTVNDLVRLLARRL